MLEYIISTCCCCVEAFLPVQLFAYNTASTAFGRIYWKIYFRLWWIATTDEHISGPYKRKHVDRPMSLWLFCDKDNNINEHIFMETSSLFRLLRLWLAFFSPFIWSLFTFCSFRVNKNKIYTEHFRWYYVSNHEQFILYADIASALWLKTKRKRSEKRQIYLIEQNIRQFVTKHLFFYFHTVDNDDNVLSIVLLSIVLYY